SYQALRPGEAAQPATIAPINRIVTSDCGAQAAMSASSDTVAGTISACERAMLTAIARRTPASGSTGPAAVCARAARSTSALVTAPPGPLALTSARSIPSRCARARTAGAALTAGACDANGGTGGGAAAESSPTIVPVSVRGPSSNSTRGPPTLTLAPGWTHSRAILPSCGEGTSTTAFSVSTETRGWSATTWSPSPTCQATSSASCSPSPRSGSTKTLIAERLPRPARQGGGGGAHAGGVGG